MGNGKSKDDLHKVLGHHEAGAYDPKNPAKVLSSEDDDPYGGPGRGVEARALSMETPIHPDDDVDQLPPLPTPGEYGKGGSDLPIQARTVTDDRLHFSHSLNRPTRGSYTANNPTFGSQSPTSGLGSRSSATSGSGEQAELLPPRGSGEQAELLPPAKPPQMHQRTISRMDYNEEGELEAVDDENFEFMDAMDDDSAWMACKIMEHIGGSMDAQHKKKATAGTMDTFLSTADRSANVFDDIIQKTLGDIQRSKRLFQERQNTMILDFQVEFKQTERDLASGDWVDVQDDAGDWLVGHILTVDQGMETCRVKYATTRELVEAGDKSCRQKTFKFAMLVRCHDDNQDETADVFSLIDKFMSQCKGLKPGEEFAWKDVKIVDIPLAREILDVLNQVRQHPKEFAEFIRSMLKLFRADEQGGIIAHTSGALIRTHEGRHAYDETIELLENMDPVPPLKLAPGLSKAADDHAMDGETRGVRGHMGSDKSNPAERAERYGDWYGNFGNCVGYPRRYYNAHDIVRMLIVDDGNKKRSQRRNILSKDFKFIGVSIRGHLADKIDRICVISFVSSYRQTRMDIEPNPRQTRRQPSKSGRARSRMMGSNAFAT